MSNSNTAGVFRVLLRTAQHPDMILLIDIHAGDRPHGPAVRQGLRPARHEFVDLRWGRKVRRRCRRLCGVQRPAKCQCRGHDNGPPISAHHGFLRFEPPVRSGTANYLIPIGPNGLIGRMPRDIRKPHWATGNHRCLPPHRWRWCSDAAGMIESASESATALPPEGSMTTATRLGNVLTGLSFGALASVGLLALPIAGSDPAMAQNQGAAALTGTVSSAEEGKMEGVVVSAKRPGSTMMVSVSTNAQGQYRFPEDRLAPGDYDITMRAVGYTLPSTKATIRAGGPTQLDLKLAKAATDVLPLQLTNSEWILSAPGTHDQKLAIAAVSRLSRPAASDLFEGRCVGNGVHVAAHDRAQRECVSQFSVLPSERIRDLEQAAEQGDGGIRRPISLRSISVPRKRGPTN